MFDIPAQTYGISLDGATLASNVAFCGSNAGCSGAVVSTYGTAIFDSFGGVNGNDSAYMDNFRVAAVPEPSSIFLLATLLGALGFRVHRKVSLK